MTLTIDPSTGIIQNQTYVTALFSDPVYKYGASFSSARLIAGGEQKKTYTSFPLFETLDPLSTNGAYVISFELTDSRGITNTISQTVDVIYNENPVFLSATAERCDSSGNITDEGDHVMINAKWVISSVSHEQSSGTNSL